MNLVAVAGVAIIAAILCAVLKRYHKEYAILIGVVAGIFILVQFLQGLTPAIEQIQSLLSLSGISADYVAVLLKALGICLLVQFSADACRDAGENALASKVEFAGKISILLLALPFFEQIASTALSLIGG